MHLLVLLLLLFGGIPQALGAADASSLPVSDGYAAPARPKAWLPSWPDPEAPSPPEVPAIRLSSQDMRLDGRLDEAQWRQSPRVTGLIRNVPVEGGAGVGPVEAFVFYDQDALWVGARVLQPPGILRAHVTPRDRMGDDDNVTLGLSPRHDMQTAVLLQCNAFGVQGDFSLVNDELSDVWDGVWYSAAARFEGGYSVEFRVPFRSLRFSQLPVQDWGLNVAVWTGAEGQLDMWPPNFRDKGSPVTQLAVLKGLTSVQPGSGFELIPSLKMQLGYTNLDHPDSPPSLDDALFRLRDPGIIDPGLDARYGVTSGISLNATLNPDFSQLEADPEQLTYNQRFPLELVEKRPFFLEGAEVFETPEALLYSRSIQDPLAGMKLAGKEGRFSVGLLSAWDQTPAASRIDGADCRTSSRLTGFECPVEDGLDAMTNVVRAATDVGESSRVGLFFTDKRLYRREDGRFSAAHELLAADGRLILGPASTLSLQAGVSHTGLLEGTPLNGHFGSVGILRETSFSLLRVTGAWHSTGFRAEAAPLYRTGYSELDASGSLKLLTHQPWMTFVSPEVTVKVVTSAYPQSLEDWTLVPGVSFHPFGNNDLGLKAMVGQEVFAEHFHPVLGGDLWASLAPTGWLQASADISGGRRTHYDTSDDFDGFGGDGNVSFTLKPGVHAGFELGYVKSLLWRDTGLLQANIDLARFKATWSFNPRWSLRLLTQVRNEQIPSEPEQAHGFVANSLLLTWLSSPGTALYLGAQDIEPLNPAEGVDRRAFVKLSYLWQ